MKKTLLALALTTAVWAAEGNVYHTISDPTWHVTRIGSRWVIEDSRGFFVGYYVPRPTPPVAAKPVTPAPPPVASAPATADANQSNAGNSYYNNGGYGYYNGGYGFYNGYGYGYNNYGHCPPQIQPPPPPKPQPEVPTGRWNPSYR